MYTLQEKVVRFALTTRVFVLVLQAIFNAVIPDHDATDVFRRPLPPISETSIADKVIDLLLGGLERWDAQYFLHIAENGYVYENTLAFFPLFPLAIRFLSSCLNLVTFGFFCKRSLLLLASVILNTTCFVKAADTLFILGISVLGNEALAYKAALLFCVNPASIFFSAPYSESIYALLAFQGMRQSLRTKLSKFCAIPFGLAAATRSNGVLNIGFILYCHVKDFILIKWPLLRKTKAMKNKLLFPFKILGNFYPLTEPCIIAVAPFIAYQAYCYALFCKPQHFNIPSHVLVYGQSKGLVLPEAAETFYRAPNHWCHFRMPLAYSYVQDHYWNVGFLRYYEWKQIPNFLLAFPIIFLILKQSHDFFQQHRNLCFNLGFIIYQNPEDKQRKYHYIMAPQMFVFAVHVVLLTLFCVAFVHIQITTRMICSASPIPYWYAAYILKYRLKSIPNKKAYSGLTLVGNQVTKLNKRKQSIDGSKRDPISNCELLDNMNSSWRVIILSKLPENVIGKVLLCYFLSYSIIGIIMFCNFLPWT